MLGSLFGLTSNYHQMIRRIAIGTFVFSFIYNLLLLHSISGYGKSLLLFLSLFQTNGTERISLFVFETPLPFFATYLLIPVVVTVLSSLVRLHDRISDVFDIRVNFDVTYILFPLFQRTTSCQLQLENMRSFLSQNRRSLMRKLFYEYTSSTNPTIDMHLIAMALNNWSLYWICLEGCFWGLVTFFILIRFADSSHFGLLVSLLIFLGLALHRLYKNAIGNVESELDALLEDPAREKRVQDEVEDALQSWNYSR